MIIQTGIAIMNHSGQVGGGFIMPTAMMFCGDEIGDAIPPTFAARAIPSMRARA